MPVILNHARRKAFERQKPSESTTASSVGETSSFISGILGRTHYRSGDSDLEKARESTCGPDCWARQADLQPLVDKVGITPTSSEHFDQDRKVALNTSIYKSLRPWQTRLIILQPGELGSNICCKLINVDVIDGPGLGISETSDVVTFEALSYCWGAATHFYSISCNDVNFTITEELAFALQYLRLPNAERYLWCDAICINQQDLPEKGRQVKNMLRIFEKADQVVGWLGRPLLTSAKLFKAIASVGPQSQAVMPVKHDENCVAALCELKSALLEQLKSPWFRRTWIRQEVYAAKTLVLQTGFVLSDFEQFCNGLRTINMALESSDLWSEDSCIPRTLMTYEDEYQHFGSDKASFRPRVARPTYVQHWLDVTNTGTLFDVTDERDRIYGALGLLASKTTKFLAKAPEELERLVERFPIDYSKSLTQVHEDAIKFLINATGTLEVLDIYQDRKRSGSSGTPAWMLDFSGNQRQYLSPQSDSVRNSRFTKLHVQDHLDFGRLRLAGLRIAKNIQSLDGRKEINHPQDRFSPKYKRSVTLQHILQGPQRRVSGVKPSGIDNPPFSFVFSYVNKGEGSRTVALSHQRCTLEMPFADFLASNKYAFAYVDESEGTKSCDLAGLHFLVPGTASLDDAIVALYGSSCLHLVRPLSEDPPEWTYMGPVAAIAIGAGSLKKYEPLRVPHPERKEEFHFVDKVIELNDPPREETFVLR